MAWIGLIWLSVGMCRAFLGTITNLLVPEDGKRPYTSGSGKPNPLHRRFGGSQFLKTYLKSGHYPLQIFPN